MSEIVDDDVRGRHVVSTTQGGQGLSGVQVKGNRALQKHTESRLQLITALKELSSAISRLKYEAKVNSKNFKSFI